ncbi:aminodeoxychorismate synthase component I [Spirosoma sp. KCTC 42546]|uniref:aminodeoxychorismate synthase component I n=1 Tax=Spirosoma sp. KCTC 42546 TaxID=2520506 RepID=UPI0011590AAB|nr:aminodeoxychorismate synthase component I [Spirosoma sp. KCTC 42546]QDK82185.1 aminodeoxychorismate synthase component I [Spirosoma sp. KCTC 42546]
MNVLRVTVDNIPAIRGHALTWAMGQQAHKDGFVAFLNNNTVAYPNDPFPNRLFVGQKRVISFSDSTAIQALADAHHAHPSFLVGYLGYDLKNQLEALNSRNPNRLGFPDAYFVEPEWIIDFEEDSLVIRGKGDPNELWSQLVALSSSPAPRALSPAPRAIQCRVTPNEYLANVRRIQQHILAGDVYELNYCIEFFAEQIDLDPLSTYLALNERSPMPFSSFLKIGDRYVMGASPERFLTKKGRTILSQPIKGTIRRGRTSEEDVILRAQLLNSEKERAENLMIVDLVRNDLARSAKTGSVWVDELFGIYGFKQVYQMISTVSATLRDDVSWADAIRNAFPMGSMTGAPKIRAMELIDELEVSRRGVYSGAVGFITPEGDFDFNVVIRTLLYNAQTQYASFSVGSAITYDADPAQEWEECLLKAKAIRDVLGASF